MITLIHRIRLLVPSAGAAVLGVVLYAACGKSNAEVANGADPLKALTVPHPSDKYGSQYWTQKSVAEPGLWTEAVSFCEGRTGNEYPNCAVVHQVRLIEQMSRMPKDRPNQFRLTIPQDTKSDDQRR